MFIPEPMIVAGGMGMKVLDLLKPSPARRWGSSLRNRGYLGQGKTSAARDKRSDGRWVQIKHTGKVFLRDVKPSMEEK